MTLIECFTKSHIDNIAACLRLKPEKLIMVGPGEKMKEAVERYRKLLWSRGMKTEIALCDVEGKDLRGICLALEAVIPLGEDCVIDLTGGEEPVIMAVGAVLTRMDEAQRRNIRVEKYDVARHDVVDCIHENRVVPYEPAQMTVEELIMLHGGKMHAGSYQPPRDCTNDDLEGLWSIVSEAPKEWNCTISRLNEFESRADSRNQVYLPLASIQGSIQDFDSKEVLVRELLDKFCSQGIIDDYSNHYALEYTYRSELLRYCVAKAGNVLEVKTLLEGRAARDGREPLFSDCRMSVTIDWDGIIHNTQAWTPDTRNEIDVILMHGLTPVFISCKNGNIDEAELYKLHTVATQFGGPYAKKMLIATDLDRKSPKSNRAFERRAKDMDIILVTDAGELTSAEWNEMFERAVR